MVETLTDAFPAEISLYAALLALGATFAGLARDNGLDVAAAFSQVVSALSRTVSAPLGLLEVPEGA